MKDAVAILIERDGKYLFVRRPSGDLFEGYWSPPTGKVEPGEIQSRTVAREALEELGLEVAPVKKVWQCVTTTGAFVLHWWTAKPLTFDLKINREEVSAYAWVAPSDIRSLGKVFDRHLYFFDNITRYI